VFALPSLLLALVAHGCSTYGSQDPTTPEPAPASDAANENDGTGAQCPAGTAECDSDPSTPCETQTSDDPTNCGSCRRACAVRANGFPTCVNGDCAIGCNTGFGDCNGVVADGCETSLATDARNCGECGRSCGNGLCTDGFCPVTNMTTGGAPTTAMTLDDLYLYYGTQEGEVRRSPKVGAGTELIATAYSAPWALARIGNDLYMAAVALQRCDVTSCAATLSTIPPSPSTAVVTSLAADDARLFVTSAQSYDGPTQILSSSLSALPDAGGFSTVAAAPVYLSSVTLDATHVYVTTLGAAWAAPKDAIDGGLLQIADGGIAALSPFDGGLAYRAEAGLAACAAPSCTNTRIVMTVDGTLSGAVGGVASDGKYFYATLTGTTSLPPGNGSVVRCPMTGCGNAPFVLAKGLHRPSLIAVDATSVYWASGKTGTIQRIVK
jgi:hypothetical protein